MIPALLILLFVEGLSYGIFAGGLGFYHDDWFLLELASQGGGFWGAVRTFARTATFWTRPIEMLQLPAFYALGGLHPLVYQLLLLGLETLEGLLFFVLLKKLTKNAELALLAAALALMCPNRAVTHVWFANSGQTVALVLALAGLILALDWIETRRLGRLGGAMACYLASVLTYESAAFMPLMLAGGLLVRAVHSGRTVRAAALETARDLSPFAAALALALGWQRVGVKVLFGGSNPKAMGLSAAHVLKAFGAGFECVANRILDICSKSARPAFAEMSWTSILLWALFASAASFLLRPRKTAEGAVLKTALAAALGGFLGAYAPYAASAAYMPQIYGMMSRTNGSGALVAGLLFATGIYALKDSRAKAALLAAVVGAFTWTNWHIEGQWARAWSVQKEILAQAAPQSAGLPQGATVILKAPHFVGDAVVFDASWDFPPALRLAARRPDLNGLVLSRMMAFTEKGLVEKVGGGLENLTPYGNLYLFDYASERLSRIDGPPSEAIDLR